MSHKFILAAATGTALTFAATSATFAQEDTSAGPASASLNAMQAIEIALAEVPGELLEVERERHRGVSYFEVEILGEDGTVSELEIASTTGEILQIEIEEYDHDDDHDPWYRFWD
jgi:uncharacterized membrane protein YkoI